MQDELLENSKVTMVEKLTKTESYAVFCAEDDIRHCFKTETTDSCYDLDDNDILSMVTVLSYAQRMRAHEEGLHG